ncbi:MAG: ABC transporter substrate-binding protein [Armatimonadota bacterium]
MTRARGWTQFAWPAAALGLLIGGALVFGRIEPEVTGKRVRVAFFPNVTHAPALAASARGELDRALPAGTSLDVKVFNAGPEAMEALLAGEIDVSYVGPSPAINTYLKSGGRALRVLAGACSGGAALVARAEVPIAAVKDLDGKRVAVPQLGGTQDVSLRHFLAREGLKPWEKGGSVEIVTAKNPDILALIQRKQVDAAWVPEPWASRLVHDAGATVAVDERSLWEGGRFTTTVLVARTKFLEEQPETVQAILRAHLQSIDWLKAQPEAGKKLVNAELKRLTGKELSEQVLDEAWARVEFTSDPHQASIETFADAAVQAGYLPRGSSALAGLFHLEPLQNALQRVAVRPN